MWRCAIFFFSVAAAGLIAGAGETAFLAAALAAAAAAWRRNVFRTPARRLYANLDPQSPDNATLAEAFRQALAIARLSQTGTRLRITARLPARSPDLQIGLSGGNAPQLMCESRRVALGPPDIWLADHPLPLTVPRTRSLTLQFTQAGPKRIRVTLDGATTLRPVYWLSLAGLIAAACAADANGALAALLGFSFAEHLLEKQDQRASDDPDVKRG